MTQPGDTAPAPEPVTRVVSPAGNVYDADSWSDANNYLNMGYTVVDGYPTGPLPDDQIAAQPAASVTAPEQTAPPSPGQPAPGDHAAEPGSDATEPGSDATA